MRTLTFSLVHLALGICLLVAAPGAAWTAEDTGEASTPEPEANLATVAEPSSSYVSGDTRNSALNDGSEPRSSRDNRRGSYGNWPRRRTQWVQYEWSKPISTRKVEVYWWDDRRGVRLPAACRLLYWDGKAFQPVPDVSGLGVKGDQWNVTTFEEVRTSRLRLKMDGSGTFSTGILEWRVLDSGSSPDFPPRVDAGVDRVVVLGGKTWLDGEVQALERKDRSPTKVRWSRAEGPGEVTFEDAEALETTATFPEPGDYVLQLKAGRGSLSATASLNVEVVSPPPATHLEPVVVRTYRLDSPLWSGRAKALITSWIPHCIERISDPDLREGGINNFVDAAAKLADKPHGRHRGYVFSNAWVYNTIESICLALGVDPRGDEEITEAQKAMRGTLEDWIPKILAAQEPDGYLQTAFTLSDRERWSPRHRADHEGYVAGYFLDAAVAHHRLTQGKDTRLYDAAKKLADCWDDHIGPPPKQEWWDGHQAMEIGLAGFGRYVNEVEGEGKGEKYIELAKFLLDCRKGGHEYDQSHLPVIRQHEAVGHAVRAVYSYAGMADVALETGDIDYHSAVRSLWDSIVNRKYYVTGGVGSGETSEGFGPDYSLPHSGYCESCSSCGEIFFQHKLGRIYHDAKYADLYEETLYNALLGSIDLEGENFYYQNPLRARRPRYPWHGCPCCVGNIPRTLLMLPTWMYLKADDAIYVQLFAGSTVAIEDVAGTDVVVTQKTDYPWSGKVAIHVEPARAAEFSMNIRVPSRDVSELYRGRPECRGLESIAVNGSPVTPRMEKGYAVLRREWRAGDRIELELPMKVQRVHGSEKIEATRGQVALRYGPLVYTFESADQELGSALPPDSALKTQWTGDLLGGVVVIRGEWADGSRLQAIPYYARSNRGGSSTVWVEAR